METTTTEPEAHRNGALASYRFRESELTVSRGEPLPLGAHRVPGGVNFVLICRHATAVHLVLCETCNGQPRAEIPLDPRLNRTGDHWHVRVAGLPEDFCYGYRVDGQAGGPHRYDPSKVLIDPASRALSCGTPWGQSGSLPRLSLVMPSTVDRINDLHPRVPLEDTIIYELHVRGFTADRSSGVRHPGTFDGLTEKIHYLNWLGVTAVELLPIDEFDETDCPFVNPYTGERNRNYWGYNPIAYAAPKAAYASNPERTAPWEEFRRMIRSLHDAGLEVILDVVFNHTAEGGEGGPTYSFRGLDNGLYYLLDEQGRYLNFTGCGNTVNGNHPVVRNLILACLRNLVAEAHVDGFRFDLASVLGRDKKGHVLVEPPVVEMISEDPLLRDTQADRRALGRRRALPGRQLPRRRPVVGVERPLPRRRPPLLEGRRRPGRAARQPPLRLGGPLRRPRPAPLAEPRDLPRRLHPLRPRLLQREAQHRQRRGQPRRPQRQLLLELRRRGADRRPGRPRVAGPAGAEPDRHADGQPGRADAPRR